MKTERHARRKDHTVDVELEQNAPLPPPTAAPSTTPIVPQARSNATPYVAGSAPTVDYTPPRAPRKGWSRTRLYTVGAVVFLAISVAGYIGFRSYIYGDDAPPVPVLDDFAD